MNKYIKQWCFAVFMLSLSSVALAAPKGICTPDNLSLIHISEPTRH